jgi:hypothetical protein
MPTRFTTSVGGHVAFELSPEHGLALIRPVGAVTGNDLARALRAICDDPRWRPAFALIWDERNVSWLDVTVTGLARMVEAQAAAEVGPDIVVNARADYQPIFELYAWRVKARGHAAAVCPTMKEALALVDLNALPESMRRLGESPSLA